MRMPFGMFGISVSVHVDQMHSYWTKTLATWWAANPANVVKDISLQSLFADVHIPCSSFFASEHISRNIINGPRRTVPRQATEGSYFMHDDLTYNLSRILLISNASLANRFVSSAATSFHNSSLLRLGEPSSGSRGNPGGPPSVTAFKMLYKNPLEIPKGIPS